MEGGLFGTGIGVHTPRVQALLAAYTVELGQLAPERSAGTLGRSYLEDTKAPGSGIRILASPHRLGRGIQGDTAGPCLGSGAPTPQVDRACRGQDPAARSLPARRTYPWGSDVRCARTPSSITTNRKNQSGSSPATLPHLSLAVIASADPNQTQRAREPQEHPIPLVLCARR